MLLRNTVALVLGLRGGVARRGTAAGIGGKPRSIIVETGPLRDGSNLRVIVGGGAAGDVPWCNISEKFTAWVWPSLVLQRFSGRNIKSSFVKS